MVDYGYRAILGAINYKTVNSTKQQFSAGLGVCDILAVGVRDVSACPNSCCNPIQDDGLRYDSTYYYEDSGSINEYKSTSGLNIDFECPENMVITGMESYMTNSSALYPDKKDFRAWKFQCGTIEGMNVGQSSPPPQLAIIAPAVVRHLHPGWLASP